MTAGQSSTKRKIFYFFLTNSKSQYNTILDNNSKVIQGLEFDLYVTGRQWSLMFLQHCELRDFLTMISLILLPVILAETKTFRRLKYITFRYSTLKQLQV